MFCTTIATNAPERLGGLAAATARQQFIRFRACPATHKSGINIRLRAGQLF